MLFQIKKKDAGATIVEFVSQSLFFLAVVNSSHKLDGFSRVRDNHWSFNLKLMENSAIENERQKFVLETLNQRIRGFALTR